MSRQMRRHDKLLTEYLEVSRARAEREAAVAGHMRRQHHTAGDPDSTNRIDRLAVRERALVAAIRHIRIELGLSGDFDPDEEAARLEAQERGQRVNRRLVRSRQDDSGPLSGPERQRVKPVPALKATQPETTQRPDLGPHLVILAARYCGWRAAEEILARRTSANGGDFAASIVTWPDQPLERDDGNLMGELVARGAENGSAAHEQAQRATRSYIDEFVNGVTDTLVRESEAAAGLIYDQARADGDLDDDLVDELIELRRQLADAACERIAVEARAAGQSDWPTATDVAIMAGLVSTGSTTSG